MLQTYSLSLQQDATICLHQLLCQEVSPAKWHLWFLLNVIVLVLWHSVLIFQSKLYTMRLCFSEVLNNPFWPEMLCYTSKKWGAEKYWEICGWETGNQIGSWCACEFRIHVFPPQTFSAEQALPGGCRGADLSGSNCALGLGGRTRAQTCDLEHCPFAGKKRVQPWAMKPNFTARSVS